MVEQLARGGLVAVVVNPASGNSADRTRETRTALDAAGLNVLWPETTREDPGPGQVRRALAMLRDADPTTCMAVEVVPAALTLCVPQQAGRNP